MAALDAFLSDAAVPRLCVGCWHGGDSVSAHTPQALNCTGQAEVARYCTVQYTVLKFSSTEPGGSSQSVPAEHLERAKA